MRNPGSYFPDEYKCIPFKRATKADKLTVKGIIDGEINNIMWNEVVGENRQSRHRLAYAARGVCP